MDNLLVDEPMFKVERLDNDCAFSLTKAIMLEHKKRRTVNEASSVDSNQQDHFEFREKSH